jgi:hypothetical protein
VEPEFPNQEEGWIEEPGGPHQVPPLAAIALATGLLDGVEGAIPSLTRLGAYLG